MLVGLIFALGVVLRVVPFVQDRALWIDEAVLADNIVRKSYAELGQPLDHHQAAALGFLWAQKWMVSTLGNGERALRVVPLVAGLLTMPVVFLLARRLCSARGTLLSLLLVAVSDPLLYFGDEMKPYILDAFLATLVLWLAVRAVQRGHRWGDLVALAIAGGAASWLSLPIVFVLAGTMVSMMGHALLQRDRVAFIRLLLPAAVFVISFGANFLLFIRFSAQSQVLQDYWQTVGAFMPLPPRSVRDVLWFIETLLNYFIDPGGFRSFGAVALLAVLGGVMLWRKCQVHLALLVAPMFVTLAAAALKKYPFATAGEMGEHWLGRVAVFSLPAVLVLVAMGLDGLARMAKRNGDPIIERTGHRREWALLAAALLIMLIHPLERIARSVREAGNGQDVRVIFEHLAANQKPGDLVYPTWPVRQLALYYRHRFPIGDPTTWISSHPILVKEMLSPDGWVRSNDWTQFENEMRAAAGRRLWLFISHASFTSSQADEKFLKHLLSRRGTILDQRINAEASLYLVQLHAQPVLSER